ncbi:MAG: cupin domain-containing protein [Nitrososphaerales archaeon]
MSNLQSTSISTCTVHHLPGRDWYYLLGPQNSTARNLAFGVAEFPAGTVAAAHMHEHEEEIIFILSGTGAILAAQQQIALEPGIAVFIPPATEHQIRVEEGEALRLVTLFSPPVVPGAYDPRKSVPANAA